MPILRRILFLSIIFSLLLSACSTSSTPSTPSTTSTTSTPIPTSIPVRITDTHPAPAQTKSAFGTGIYRNLFAEYLGKTDREIQTKIDAAWNQFFNGNDNFQRIYYPVGTDMAYIEDIGNQDVRSEGMSYGMMIAVQLDKKEEFDRIWKWAHTYMYQIDGPYKGYFAWHCTTDGTKLDSNPASDGEEWFVTALFFASARWGNGQAIFNYQQEAQAILDTMRTKTAEGNGIATDMFDPQQKQVVFVPKGNSSTYTDPSYHLPAYYELWARWAIKDNQFWADAAKTSRSFFKKAANPQTGLMADYANFDGTPYSDGDHKDFRFDAWRTLSNVAVDYSWFTADPWQVDQSTRVLDFLAAQGLDSYPNQFALNGKALSADHSTGLVSMAAVAALAADPKTGKPFVQALWDTKIPTNTWRYYDGMLYMLALLHVSGNFRIFTPGSLPK